MQPAFGHSAETLRFWRGLVTPLLRGTPTPFYLFSAEPVADALAELDAAFAGLPVRHWLSCKTQPLRPLLRWWRRERGGIEVVSEFELRAALAEGFAPARILVNGPAKHHWLPRCGPEGLLVNFDSTAELRALLPLAKRRRWSAGLRLRTAGETDAADAAWPVQFGFSPAEFVHAARTLRAAGLPVERVHFHLRTNVPDASHHTRAVEELAAVCAGARVSPRVVDIGGGFPPANILDADGARLDEGFKLGDMHDVLARLPRKFPALGEIWMENGRHPLARSGVLVVRVLDVKESRGRRHLVCDGGRTMNALLSVWEQHGLFSVPCRAGRNVPATVTGPTCMAYDQLARRPLPRSLRAGDVLVWLDAGAYHLPWETRFSHGLAGVYWHEGKRIRRVRAAETFKAWWGQWRG